MPRFLLGGQGTALDPADGPGFFASCLRDILSSPESPSACAGPELVYSIFVPTFASLGGRIGSLLSLLPFLSFLRRELGVDTVITLPLTVIGSVHRKGVRGSPFAARDPFAIDESYADTLLPSWSAHDLYLAVVEAAGCLGIRFGSIAPLATLSIDSELIARFPDLTYWWHARPGELLVAEANGSAPAITAATTKALPPGGGAPRAGTKTAAFLDLVTGRHGPLATVPVAQVSRICTDLAPRVGLDTGAARTALRKAVLAARNHNGGPR